VIEEWGVWFWKKKKGEKGGGVQKDHTTTQKEKKPRLAGTYCKPKKRKIEMKRPATLGDLLGSGGPEFGLEF